MSSAGAHSNTLVVPGATIGSSSNSQNVSLVPPPGFTYIDERLSRCLTPFLRTSAQFCSVVKIERILNFSQEGFSPEVLQLLEIEGIKVVGDFSITT
jgi:hypothetical protein